jgi:hypothetical protein
VKNLQKRQTLRPPINTAGEIWSQSSRILDQSSEHRARHRHKNGENPCRSFVPSGGEIGETSAKFLGHIAPGTRRKLSRRPASLLHSLNSGQRMAGPPDLSRSSRLGRGSPTAAAWFPGCGGRPGAARSGQAGRGSPRNGRRLESRRSGRGHPRLAEPASRSAA